VIQVEGFNIRIVSHGDGYGKDDCLILDNWESLVEFYDAKQDTEKFGPRGQFVSRYYLITILGAEGKHGLQLDGGVPEWSISPQGMREVKRYIKGYLQEVA